jgi:DnaJ-class molecular chaperone
MMIRGVVDLEGQMKKPAEKPRERKCPACNGTGFPVVTKSVQPGRKIYPTVCKRCGGKGRIPEAAN